MIKNEVKQTVHVKSFKWGKPEAGLKCDKQLLHFVQEQRKADKLISHRTIQLCQKLPTQSR
jgi:hypothetical protein